MLYNSQEISKVSPNLSLRLSPERKFNPRYVSCSICHCCPCSCCLVCHYYPCKCCISCHCWPCKCYCSPVRCYSPVRCCSPCYSPCRALSPVSSGVRRPNSPSRLSSMSTNIRTYNSPSKLRNQNNYNNYEEKQFNDFLRKLMQVEGAIESAKINLALKPDFNCEDAFRIFELNGRGFLDENDLKCGLNAIGVVPTNQELRLLMKRFDLQKEGSLNYADFFDLLVPFEKEYRTTVENRCPNSCCPCNCPDVFCYSTLCALRNVFNLIINSENQINNMRKLFGTLRLKLRDIFGLLDYLRRGYFTNSDLVVYLQNRGLYNSSKDTDLLFIRLDKNRTGKIDYGNVEEEIRTLY